MTEIWRTQYNLCANYKEQNTQQAGLNHALVNLIVIAAVAFVVVAVLFAVCHFPRPPTGKIHSVVYSSPPFTPFYQQISIDMFMYVGNRKAATATDKSQKQTSEICLLTHTAATHTRTHVCTYAHYVYAPHLARVSTWARAEPDAGQTNYSALINYENAFILIVVWVCSETACVSRCVYVSVCDCLCPMLTVPGLACLFMYISWGRAQQPHNNYQVPIVAMLGIIMYSPHSTPLHSPHPFSTVPSPSARECKSGKCAKWGKSGSLVAEGRGFRFRFCNLTDGRWQLSYVCGV